MTRHPADPTDFLPLTPAIAHILLALADGDRHGYGIMQEIVRMTDGAVRMGPGTLYGTIKRMLASGLLEESDERPADDDERRRYYRSSPLGRAALAAETGRIAALLGAARAKRVGAR